MTNYNVTLTNISKRLWFYSVKSTNPKAAGAAAKKRHNGDNKNMPKLTIVEVVEDARPYLQRAKDYGNALLKNAEGSFEYRYGQVLKFKITQDLHNAYKQRLYWHGVHTQMQIEFNEWIKTKRKEWKKKHK